MCDVVSWVTIGAAVLGGAVSYQQSKNAQAYTEQVAEQNQKIAEVQATDAERLGQREAQQRRMATRLQLGQQRAGFGAQNVEATGTALDILGDTAMFGQIDEDSIRANAQRQAWGLRMQGWNAQADKAFARFKGQSDRAGILLSTAGGVAGGVAGGWSGGWSGGGGGGGKLNKSGSLLTTQRTKSVSGYRKVG